MFGKTFIFTSLLVACLSQSVFGQAEFYDGAIVGDEFIEVPTYEMPTVKFTFDGYLFTRTGGDSEQPWILEGEFPAEPSLTSGDLDFQSRIGGRAELIFYAQPGGFAPRASVLWTGTELSQGEKTGNPADIIFFNGTDADPAPGYTARNRSRFTFGDVGVRRTVSPTYGWSAGLAFGQLIESMDLISAPDPNNPPAPTPGGGTTETGFFSQVHNEFYGFQLGLDGQLWSNGRSKIEGGLTGGIFYNDISVGAQALNVQQHWDSSETAFVGTANISLVIPADPFNFRIGYQGAYLSGMALPASQSRERSIVRGTGSDPTDDVWYHGLLFGIEFVR